MQRHSTTRPADLPTPSPHPAVRPWPAEATELLARAEQMLQAEGPQPALDLLARSKDPSAWVVNARAVCLLRLGETERALELFRGLVLGPVGIGMRDAPTVFKANYAAAQLLTGNLTGCIVTLGQARDEAHPSVQRLREAIRRWERGLPFWEKVRWYLGGSARRPVELDRPGDLG